MGIGLPLTRGPLLAAWQFHRIWDTVAQRPQYRVLEKLRDIKIGGRVRDGNDVHHSKFNIQTPRDKRSLEENILSCPLTVHVVMNSSR